MSRSLLSGSDSLKRHMPDSAQAAGNSPVKSSCKVKVVFTDISYLQRLLA